jgi:hypothetical protein
MREQMLTTSFGPRRLLRRLAYGILVISVIIPTIYYWFWQLFWLFRRVPFYVKHPDIFLSLGPTVVTPKYAFYHLCGFFFTLLTPLVLWWPEVRRRKLRAQEGAQRDIVALKSRCAVWLAGLTFSLMAGLLSSFGVAQFYWLRTVPRFPLAAVQNNLPVLGSVAVVSFMFSAVCIIKLYRYRSHLRFARRTQ